MVTLLNCGKGLHWRPVWPGPRIHGAIWFIEMLLLPSFRDRLPM